MFGVVWMVPKKKTALDYGNIYVNSSLGCGGGRVVDNQLGAIALCRV